MYSCGGNTTARPLAIAACSVLLAIVVLSAGQLQPAAAEVPSGCAKCNGDCVAGCTAAASAACTSVCQMATSSCEPCKANSIKTCSGFCYAQQCRLLQGCPEDVATMCGVCESTCLQRSFASVSGCAFCPPTLQPKSYTDCLAQNCVQGTGCPSSLLKWP